MNHTEIYTAVSGIDERFLSASEDIRGIAGSFRRERLRKAGMIASACVCLAVMIGTAVHLFINRTPTMPVPNPDGTIEREPVPDTWPEQTILRPGDEGYVYPEEPLQPEDLPTNGFCYFSDAPLGDQDFLPITPMISAYGGVASYNYEGLATENGLVRHVGGLDGALEQYGDTVNYRVYVIISRDGVRIPDTREAMEAEARRLAELGYIVAVETFSWEYGAQSESYFTLHASYDQIQEFPADNSLGYTMMLYGEFFGETESDPVVFNSANNGN
ncbi:MAG: hypothetical protein Q4D71_09915 [Oscillospiraceae bacterium]|nr:hypothetical protein [Oscillospiraceae bacterium]